MAKKVHNIPKDNNILRIPIEEAMPDNYLPYAVEVAKDMAETDKGIKESTDSLLGMMKELTFGNEETKNAVNELIKVLREV